MGKRSGAIEEGCSRQQSVYFQKGSVQLYKPLCPFLLRIPGAYQVDDAGKESTLTKPNQETNSIKLLIRSDGRSTEGEDRPKNLECRNHIRRTKSCDQDDSWELRDNITSSENVARICELVAIHLQRFFHARDVGIAQVSLVEILAEVPKTRVGQEIEVELE